MGRVVVGEWGERRMVGLDWGADLFAAKRSAIAKFREEIRNSQIASVAIYLKCRRVPLVYSASSRCQASLVI